MPRLYDLQREAIFAPERISIIEASTKAGKTLGCLIWQSDRVLRDKQRMNHWWIAPVYMQAAIAFERAKKMLPQHIYDKNDGEMRIDMKNGARWWFKSGEKPDNLYGEDVASAVIDEATRMREESWHAIRSTVTATRAPIRIIGNVKGRRNWAYQLARKAKAGQLTDTSYHKITAADAVAANILSAQEIGDAKQVLPHHVFRELYYAEPSDDEGNPFSIMGIQACFNKEVIGELPIVYGVDLAKSHDWTVICGIDNNGHVSYLERWQSDWRATRRRLHKIIGNKPALIDSTGVGDPIVEDLQRDLPDVEGFKFTSESKQQLMEGLALAIHNRTITYNEDWLVSELESFEYTYTRTKTLYSAPEGMHDDGVCALALAVRHWTRQENNTFTCNIVSPENDVYDPDAKWVTI